MKIRKLIIIVFIWTYSLPSYAIFGDGGAGYAQLPYIIQIWIENIRRFQQLKSMIDQANDTKNFFNDLHSGLNSLEGIISTLPIKDNGVLGDLKTFKQSFQMVERVYGTIPKSTEFKFHSIQDNTVAESLRMVNSFKEFTKDQDSNSDRIRAQSQDSSPKGAARSTAMSNALILKSINQLIKLQNQSLKMQSAQLAISNKKSKSGVKSHNKVNSDVNGLFKNLKHERKLIRF